jgi:predicted transcriptional regulator
MISEPKTARISLYVTPTCRAQLDQLWRDTGRQKSEIVAEALAQYFAAAQERGVVRDPM